MRSWRFWDVTQCWVVFIYRRFGISSRFSCNIWDGTDRLVQNVCNYEPTTLCNIPEGRRAHYPNICNVDSILFLVGGNKICEVFFRTELRYGNTVTELFTSSYSSYTGVLWEKLKIRFLNVNGKWIAFLNKINSSTSYGLIHCLFTKCRSSDVEINTFFGGKGRLCNFEMSKITLKSFVVSSSQVL